jgi:hypothetical protein
LRNQPVVAFGRITDSSRTSHGDYSGNPALRRPSAYLAKSSGRRAENVLRNEARQTIRCRLLAARWRGRRRRRRRMRLVLGLFSNDRSFLISHSRTAEKNGIILAAALAGFVDTHSAAISVASLVASGKVSAVDAVLPILTGLSTNTISKLVLAGTSGGRSFAVRVMPGLILVVLAAWGGALYAWIAA